MNGISVFADYILEKNKKRICKALRNPKKPFNVTDKRYSYTREGFSGPYRGAATSSYNTSLNP
jgi:hypothetical protein